MKNVIKILGIVAVVAVLGFSSVSCGFLDNPFEGIWAFSVSEFSYALAMTDSAWILSINDVNTYSGTYTWSGTKANLKGSLIVLDTSIPSQTIEGTATVAVNLLTLSLNESTFAKMIFTKSK